MTSIGKWSLSGIGITTVVTGAQLNGLASATMSTAGATYDNSANLDLYVDLEVFLDTLPGTGAVGSAVNIYVGVSEDGTNFPAQSAGDMRLTSTQLLCTVPMGVTSGSTQRVVVRNLVIPPKKLQFYLDNQTGQALAATANNTVKIVAYNYNLNG
jgi:hypothetical protein